MYHERTGEADIGGFVQAYFPAFTGLSHAAVSLLVYCGGGVIALLALAVGLLWLRLRRALVRSRHQARALEEARRQEALATLAGGIAHDFNNILGSIMGFGALLEDDLITQPDLRAMAQQITIAARRGQGIVAQLMSYSKKNMADDRQMLLPVSLDAVIRENIALARPSIRSSSRITYLNNARDDVVMATPTQVGQALLNLCINADHAIGVKTGTIAITLDNAQVAKAAGSAEGLRMKGDGETEPLVMTNGLLSPGSYVRISVTDDGEGMTREIAQRIFDPFFTTKDVNVGTGLGLPAIQGIMQGYGGAITVSTRRFKGTTFALLFPAGTGAPSPAVPQVRKVLQ
jgi:signal transduction histidine kinase